MTTYRNGVTYPAGTRTPAKAASITITDTDNQYSSSNVEDALSEVRGETLSYVSKAQAVLETPVNGTLRFINGSDGGLFKEVTGAAAGTYSDNGGSYCGTQFIPTGGDGSAAWVRVYHGPVFMEWFTGSADDITTGFQLLIDDQNIFDVSLSGYNELSSTVSFNRGNIRIVGRNSVQLWAQPATVDDADDIATEIKLTHTGDAFQLTRTTAGNDRTTSNITFKDILFSGNSTASRSSSCFLWDVGGDAKFSRGFIFDHCSAKWFTEVFAFTQSTPTGGNTTQKQIGDIQITGSCSFNFNDAVINTGTLGDHVQINKFMMNHNDISNNTTIGTVTFFSGTVIGNVMEGHADTLTLISCKNFDVKNNHFEANTGDSVIKVTGDSRYGTIGPNYYGSVTAKRYVWLDQAYRVECFDTFIPNQAYDCLTINNLKYDNTGAAERSYGAMVNFAVPSINSINGNVARQASTNHLRVSGATTVQTNTKLSNERVLLKPFTNATTSDTITLTKSFTASSGDYLVVSFLMRRDDAPAAASDPYIQFNVNSSSTTTKGSWESPLNNFEATMLSNNDTDEVLVTFFAKALEAVTTVQLIIYPYGIYNAVSNDNDGKTTRYSALEIHATTNMNEITHSLNLEVLNTADAAPASGTWVLGDAIENRNPSASGIDRWRCTTAGAPGTWQGVSSLQGIGSLANSATPTVLNTRTATTGGTTTITDLTNGVEGQIVTILSEHAITITDGTNIFLNGSANFVMASTDSLTLIQKADGNWYEISRSVN